MHQGNESIHPLAAGGAAVRWQQQRRLGGGVVWRKRVCDALELKSSYRRFSLRLLAAGTRAAAPTAVALWPEAAAAPPPRPAPQHACTQAASGTRHKDGLVILAAAKRPARRLVVACLPAQRARKRAKQATSALCCWFGAAQLQGACGGGDGREGVGMDVGALNARSDRHTANMRLRSALSPASTVPLDQCRQPSHTHPGQHTCACDLATSSCRRSKCGRAMRRLQVPGDGQQVAGQGQAERCAGASTHLGAALLDARCCAPGTRCAREDCCDSCMLQS